MNIAESVKSYYKSDDFKDSYMEILFENFHNQKDDIIDRIKQKFNVENYETEKCLGETVYVDTNAATKIFEHISENIDEYASWFAGYYVGYTSLESVTFGEQEEQLSGHNDWVDFKDEMIEMFEDADFTVNGEYAYYIVDGGLHIDLLNSIDSMKGLLTELNLFKI